MEQEFPAVLEEVRAGVGGLDRVAHQACASAAHDGLERPLSPPRSRGSWSGKPIGMLRRGRGRGHVARFVARFARILQQTADDARKRGLTATPGCFRLRDARGAREGRRLVGAILSLVCYALTRPVTTGMVAESRSGGAEGLETARGSGSDGGERAAFRPVAASRLVRKKLVLA